MKFLVLGIGGDARYGYVAKALEDDGYTVTKDPSEADVVVLPFNALDNDGIHVWGTNEVYAEIMAKVPAHAKVCGAMAPDREVLNYLEEPGMKYFNGICTAEGALTLAMQHSKKTIWNSNCLVLGNGHIGNYLSQILRGMGAHVTQASRSVEGMSHSLAYGNKSIHIGDIKNVIPEQDIIFNSIPALVMGEEELKAVRKDAVLVEIAAGRHGFDLELAKQLEVPFVVGVKLPGNFSPDTAGRAIAESVLRLIGEAK
ncbi:MAG: hypothetical protein IJF53_07335 [Clostridia bacterium]|nr:hypothetical protein [Clostridia bacterium]